MSNIDKMRPLDMHKKALLLREKSGVEFYLNEKDTFVEYSCPACVGGGNEKVSFYKYGFKHMSCLNCNTVFVSPRPTEEKIFEYYANYEAPSFWTQLLTQTNNERKYLQHIPRVNMLKEIIEQSDNQKKLFVDLGAGNGNFSKAVQEVNLFQTVLATDISDECIASCKKQGLKAKKCTIESFNSDTIDCITFNDLIEHLFSPYDFLQSCYSKLKDNGILMLSTPNGEGFDFKILKDKTENITPPEHLQYFNPISIKILLEKVGFEIISISTPGILDVSIIKRQIKEKKYDIKSNNEFLDFLYSLDNEQLEQDFQSFLQKNNLSSHMLVFAKKKI